MTFERAGYTPSEAQKTMLTAVHLAHTAKARFLAERPDVAPSDVKIALSLGSYGGVVDGLHEFDGIYPAPYGPADAARNTFTDAEKAQGDEERSIALLEAFYAERLAVFVNDAETWGMLDWLAFETVPLLREVRAIRRAVGALGPKAKPWWVSNVFPGGKLPEATEDTKDATTRKLVRELFGHDDRALPIPNAIGINCTSVENVREIVDVLASSVKQPSALDAKPWLALYPNGGDWDRAAHSWALDKGAGDWVKKVVNVVREQTETDVWGGLMVGGCCKIGPQDIAALATAVENL